MRISDWSSDVCSSDRALATMISYAFLPILTHLASKKLLCVAYEWGKISVGLAMMIVASVLLFVFSQYFSNFKLIGISVFVILTTFLLSFRQIGRASCRERVCQYV